MSHQRSSPLARSAHQPPSPEADGGAPEKKKRSGVAPALAASAAKGAAKGGLAGAATSVVKTGAMTVAKNPKILATLVALPIIGTIFALLGVGMLFTALSGSSAGDAAVGADRTVVESGALTDEESDITKAATQRTVVSPVVLAAISGTPPSGDGALGAGGFVHVGGDMQKVLDLLVQQVGKPYVWGTAGPSTFDCSGLVYWVYMNALGIDPGGKGTISQANSHYKTVPISQAKPGDVMGWLGDGQNGSRHVMIYIGNGEVIHAANPSLGVIRSPLSQYIGQVEFVKRIVDNPEGVVEAAEGLASDGLVSVDAGDLTGGANPVNSGDRSTGPITERGVVPRSSGLPMAPATPTEEAEEDTPSLLPTDVVSQCGALSSTTLERESVQGHVSNPLMRSLRCAQETFGFAPGIGSTEVSAGKEAAIDAGRCEGANQPGECTGSVYLITAQEVGGQDKLEALFEYYKRTFSLLGLHSVTLGGTTYIEGQGEHSSTAVDGLMVRTRVVEDNAGVTSTGISTSVLSGGMGMYHISEGATYTVDGEERKVTEELANDYAWASDYIADQMNQRFRYYDGIDTPRPTEDGALVFDFEDETPYHIPLYLSDMSQGTITIDGNVPARGTSTADRNRMQDVRNAHIQVLLDMPLEGIDEDSAGRIYDIAFAYFIQDDIQQCTTVDVPEEDQEDLAEVGASTITPSVTDAAGNTVTLTDSQLANLAKIKGTLTQMNATSEEAVAVYAVAWGESNLTNLACDSPRAAWTLDYDHDRVQCARGVNAGGTYTSTAVGVFQQIATYGWSTHGNPVGSPEQYQCIMDPACAVKDFLERYRDVAAKNPSATFGEKINGVQGAGPGGPAHFQKSEPVGRQLAGIAGVTTQQCSGGFSPSGGSRGAMSSTDNYTPWIESTGHAHQEFGWVTPFGSYPYQCVDFTLFRVNEYWGGGPDNVVFTNQTIRNGGRQPSAHGKNWAPAWKNMGFEYGLDPVPGALASWTAGSSYGNFGHVAVVKDVSADGNTVLFEESAWIYKVRERQTTRGDAGIRAFPRGEGHAWFLYHPGEAQMKQHAPSVRSTLTEESAEAGDED